MRIARAASYDSLGTFEFLLDATASATTRGSPSSRPTRGCRSSTPSQRKSSTSIWCRRRSGSPPARASPTSDSNAPARPRGYAIQARVNLETMTPAGETVPSAGRIGAFDIPSGPGVRVDTFGYSGYRAGAAFISLIAKVIAHVSSPDFAAAAAKAARALGEFRIAGVETNIGFLQAVLADPDFLANRDRHALCRAPSRRPFSDRPPRASTDSISRRPRRTPATPARRPWTVRKEPSPSARPCRERSCRSTSPTATPCAPASRSRFWRR